MKPDLLTLVDDVEYIRNDPYQGQLAEVLDQYFRVTMVSMKQIRLNLPMARKPDKFDLILSVLRMRTLADELDLIGTFLQGAPVTIYEQDVWAAFQDDSPWKGAYHRIQGRLNVVSFLVTSRWWRDFIRARGLRGEFVRMGMLQRYCNIGPSWNDRDISLGFQGTNHPHRKVLFDDLAKKGLPVNVLPSVPYQEFLVTIQRMRIYIHSEDSPWMIDGLLLPRNALWIKETEAAARGTFAIRNYDEDAEAYAIYELPTVFTYSNKDEIPQIIRFIESMPITELTSRIESSVRRMKSRNDWLTVVRALKR